VLRPARQPTPQAGRVTTSTLLVAVALFVVTYGVTCYGPLIVQTRAVRALIGEAGQAAARSDVAAGQAFVRGHAAELPWVTPESLYWHRLPDGRVLIGARWDVVVPHVGLVEQTLSYEWYCVATRDDCERVHPEWD